MVRSSAALFALAGLIAGGWACTDPTVIGGDLLDEEDLPITFTDTVDLAFATQRLEPSPSGGIQALGTAPGAAAVSFGCLDDPAVGTTRAAIGFELIVADPRDSLDGLLQLAPDSAVLSVPLAPAFQVGDTTAAVNLRVAGVAPGSVDLTESLTSDSLERSGVTLGAYSAVPPRDSVEVEVFSRDGTSERVRRAATLRIPLDAASFTEAAIAPARLLFAAGDEDDDFIVDTAFTEAFGGLLLEHDPGAGCSSTLPALDLSSARLDELTVTVYVTQRSGAVAEYDLALRRGTAVGIANLRPVYVHDYADSPAAEAIEGGLAEGDGFVQGLDGLGLELSLPDPSAGTSAPVAVNYAVLDLPIVRDGFADPLDFLDIQVLNSVGDLVGTDGFTLVGEPGRTDAILRVAPYGPAVDSVDVYRFNVTEYLQGVTAGEREAAVTILPRSSRFVAGRSILNIVADDDLPGARLLLATTELP